MQKEEQAHPRVLGVVGSPRRGGNTDFLVEAVLTGAEKAGALTEKIILNELEIKPCQACNRCRETGSCVHEDDLPELLEKMQRSQVWVLGTPVYWWGPTSQFKAFVDRWYGAKHVNFAEKKVILAIPLGGGKSTADHTVGMLTSTLTYLGMELLDTLLAPGVNGLGEVREHASVMQRACHAGRDAVKALLHVEDAKSDESCLHALET
ncbi:MAG: flavodoxin family protein [Promethearchaeota archaeon]